MSQESGKKKTTEQDDIHPRWKSDALKFVPVDPSKIKWANRPLGQNNNGSDSRGRINE